MNRADLCPIAVAATLLLGTLSLTACGGGGDAEAVRANPTANATDRPLVRVTPEPAGTQCATGGNRIAIGIDTNGDATLQDSEVTQTQYVCGLTGLDTLVTTTPASASSCPYGGHLISSGYDSNRNAVLDSAEVTSATAVCNGAPNTNPPVNGHNSLTRVSAEAAGANCPYGGLQVRSGLDLNDNDALETTEVVATNYLCNGSPGGMPWLAVSADTLMIVNQGYIPQSATMPVTLTLPATPTVGDSVRIQGSGAAGWVVAQQAGQTIQVSNLSLTPPTAWTTSGVGHGLTGGDHDGVELQYIGSGRFTVISRQGSPQIR